LLSKQGQLHELLKKGGVEGQLHTFNGAPKGVLQKLQVFGGCSMVELVEQSWFGGVEQSQTSLDFEYSFVLREVKRNVN
jgi:hypothetical protein